MAHFRRFNENNVDLNRNCLLPLSEKENKHRKVENGCGLGFGRFGTGRSGSFSVFGTNSAWSWHFILQEAKDHRIGLQGKLTRNKLVVGVTSL